MNAAITKQAKTGFGTIFKMGILKLLTHARQKKVNKIKVSVSIVATAAPKKLNLGIKNKFKTIFINAPAPAISANLFCLFAEIKTNQIQIYKNFNNTSQDKTWRATTEFMKFLP